MATSSVAELKGRIAAGEYAVDSRKVAGEILFKSVMIRRVARMMSEDEEGAAGRGAQSRRRARSQGSQPTRPRRERLP
jgi:hypothetical protein